METKWPTGFLRDVSPKMAALYLASNTNILSDAFVRSLGEELLVNKVELARELDYPQHCTEGLYYWCKSPDSTIFVLVSVLSQLGRADCVHRIGQYLQMYSMQLFIKVEQAATHGSPYATNPKFYQVTTSCEFTLVQALENILGGDLVHYEITGPGTWVTWTTLTKELKGQQLTLVYHNQPSPHTQAVLYGSSYRGTEAKQTLVANNMPVNFDANEETDLKAFIHTQIDSLKFAPESPVTATDSNNVTSCGSVYIEEPMLDKNKLDETNMFPQLCNQNSGWTLDSQTLIKIPVACKNNTPSYMQLGKVLPDKEIDSISNDHDKTIKEQNSLQVINNVPHFSYREQDQSTISFNVQSLTSQTDQRLTSQTDQRIASQTDQRPTSQTVQRLTSQTAQSNILPIAQNPSIQTTQTMKPQAIQNLFPQSDCATKQNNFNNLSCMTTTSNHHTSFVQNSLDFQIVQKGATLQTMTSPGNQPPQIDTDAENSMYVDVSNCQFLVKNIVVSDTELAASPLFTQAGQAQRINTSSCSHPGDYVSHACIQNVNTHYPNLDPVAASVQGQHSGFVAASSQRMPRLDGLTSPELQAKHHHHLQQQAFLERKMLEMYQLQRLQQVQSFIAATAASDSRTDTTHHPSDQQQFWNVLPNVSQASELQYQGAHHRRSSGELGQNLTHQQLNKTPQSFPLSRASHQQLSQQQLSQQQLSHQQISQQQLSHQQLSQQQLSQQQLSHQQLSHQQFQQPHQHSHCETQSLTKQPPISRTPQQQSFNVITEQNYHPPSGFQHRQFQELHLMNTSLNQKGNTTFQLEEQSSNEINSNTRSGHNLTVSNTQPVGGEHSCCVSTLVKPQQQNSLPNFEFTVRLPQPNSNTMSSTSQILISPRNKPNAGSGSSGSPVGRSVKFADNGATSSDSDTIFHNSGATYPDSGAAFSNNGATFYNSGVTGTPNSGITGLSCGATFSDSGGTFHNSSVTVPNSGVSFSNNCATFQNSGVTFSNNGATFQNSGVTFSNNIDCQFTHAGPSRTNSVETSRKEFLPDDLTAADEEGYNYIDKGHSPEDKSQSVNLWPRPATPKRYGYSLATELLHIEGWCPQVNGDTILSSMKMHQSKDGSYIVWKSRRHNNFVITVSHLNKLFHFRVEETQHEARHRIVYYLFEGGFRSESLLDLLQHYRQNSIRIPMKSTSGTKTYMEHIRLSHPVKPVVKRITSRST